MVQWIRETNMALAARTARNVIRTIVDAQYLADNVIFMNSTYAFYQRQPDLFACMTSMCVFVYLGHQILVQVVLSVLRKICMTFSLQKI